MKSLALLLATVAVAATTPALANQELATKHACTACHAIDKKMVGPAFKEVAAKYRGKPDAEAMLVTKVKKGGSGVWGQVPMPPNAAVSDADVKTLVKWILAIK
jgi:cytochrome c